MTFDLSTIRLTLDIWPLEWQGNLLCCFKSLTLWKLSLATTSQEK